MQHDKPESYTTDKRLADEVRGCAERLANAMNAAGKVGLTVKVEFKPDLVAPIYDGDRYVGNKTNFVFIVDVTRTVRI